MRDKMNIKILKFLFFIKNLLKIYIYYLILDLNIKFINSYSYNIYYKNQIIFVCKNFQFMNKEKLIKNINTNINTIKYIQYYYKNNNIIIIQKYRKPYIKMEKIIFDEDLQRMYFNENIHEVNIHINYFAKDLEIYNKIYKIIHKYIKNLNLNFYLIDNRRINIVINNSLTIKLPENVSLKKLDIYFKSYYSQEHKIIDLRFKNKILITNKDEKNTNKS
ncbi:hypothetical protein AB836_01270 [Rickettsiales bacterium (ex Bugula neritina AB1)]|nr:hypothetical protein AB836_01270 [Rickettsiales bacterium (ex Bugula neritina AB1)]